jgi:hypothetical protein
MTLLSCYLSRWKGELAVTGITIGPYLYLRKSR